MRRRPTRHYDAAQGAFMEVDPEPSQDGSADTVYSYVSQDPINHPTDILDQKRVDQGILATRDPLEREAT